MELASLKAKPRKEVNRVCDEKRHCIMTASFALLSLAFSYTSQYMSFCLSRFGLDTHIKQGKVKVKAQLI